MNTRESKVFSIDDGPNVGKCMISPDDRFVAAASGNTVRIWDVATGVLVDCLRGHDAMVWSVAFTHDGKGLVSCSENSMLKYWEFSTALRDTHETGGQFSKCIQDFTGHRGDVNYAAISHDGQWIVSSSADCGVQFWDRHGRTHLMLQGHHDSGTRISLPVF